MPVALLGIDGGGATLFAASWAVRTAWERVRSRATSPPQA